jgi:low affinity Fe/Cu permease
MPPPGAASDPGTIAPPEPGIQRESPFERVADYVSAAMGRPANIIVWVILVAAWTALGPYLAVHPFLPAWAVSTGWNFPLNLVTTVAELFIGFLVAAASNRSERNLASAISAIIRQEQHISDMESALRDEIAVNTRLTRQVHKLAVSTARQLGTTLPASASTDDTMEP